MARWAACGDRIWLGGKRDGDRVYCNNTCYQHVVREVNPTFAPGAVEQEVVALHEGSCPACHGPGPIDVYKTHHIASFIFITRTSTKAHLCCRSCARKKQLGAIGLCAVTGWWGIPVGIIGTPYQIILNIIEMASGAKSAGPSPLLNQVAANSLADKQVLDRSPAAMPSLTEPAQRRR